MCLGMLMRPFPSLSLPPSAVIDLAGVKPGTVRVNKLFIDPSGRHLIISTQQSSAGGVNFYCESSKSTASAM
jgi:hypothetical protein